MKGLPLERFHCFKVPGEYGQEITSQLMGRLYNRTGGPFLRGGVACVITYLLELGDPGKIGDRLPW